MTRFHARALGLLPAMPAVTTAATEAVGRVERRIGRPLPVSVRDWYCHAGACEILDRYSNDDPAVGLAELGRPLTDWQHGGSHDLAAEGLLVFRHENQGVCSWAVRLDGSDDPPVVVSFEAGFRDPRPCADTFSDYVFACVWDYTFVFGREPLIQAQNAPLTGPVLRRLRGLFGTGVTTHGWPGRTQHRFEGDGLHLLIWADDDQADWWLSARSEDALASAMERVWALDRVGDAFWSNAEEGQALVDRLRATAR